MTEQQRKLIDKALRLLVGRVNDVRWQNKPPPRSGPMPEPASAQELAKALREVRDTMSSVISVLEGGKYNAEG